MTNRSNNLSQSVIIIGAGAHSPYGFPTSRGLTAKFQELLRDNETVSFLRNENSKRPPLNDLSKIKHELVHIAYKLNFIDKSTNPRSSNEHELSLGMSLNDFTASFCESGAYSIDSYLSKLTQTKKLDTDANLKSKWGRLLVAYLIWLNEVQLPLGSHNHDWIEYIINRHILKNYKLFFSNPPKFITFNYDRFLERRIYKHLTQFHGISDREAAELVNQLGITHVYGSIGDFSEWPQTTNDTFMQTAMERIQVIGETRSDQRMEEVKSEIYHKISVAQKIYFLGYGFDSQNNNVLFERFEKDERKQLKTYSTNIGISNNELAEIEDSLGFLPNYLRRSDRVSDVDSLLLIKELEPLDKKPAKDQQITSVFR